MPKIDELFAFIAEDTGPDDEGVAATFLPRFGVWIPLVGADMDRMKSLIPEAQRIAQVSGKSIKLVRFSQRTELEVIEP